MTERIVKLIPAYIIVNAVLAMISGVSWYEFGVNVLTGSASVPFYFVIILFQLYLLYPLIAELSHKRWFVFGAFWVSVVFLFLWSTWYLFEVPTAFRYIFFFVWGIYMREQILLGRLNRTWAPWVIITALSVLAYAILPGQYFNMRPFYGLSVMIILYLFFTSGLQLGMLEKGLSWIGSISLWIFLTHFPVMEFVLPLLWKNVSMSGTFALVTSIIISIAVSVPFGYMCTKIYNSAVTVFSGRVRKEV